MSSRSTRASPAARISWRTLAHGLPIDIHFHTFTPNSLHQLLLTAGFIEGDEPRFELIASAELYPPGRLDGIGMLLRKTATTAQNSNPSVTFTVQNAHASIL